MLLLYHILSGTLPPQQAGGEFLRLKVQSEKTEIRIFSTSKDGQKKCVDEKGNLSKLQYLGIQTDGNNENLRGKTTSKFHRKLAWQIKKEVKHSRKNKNGIAKRRLYKKNVYNKDKKFIDYAKMAGNELNSQNISEQFSDKNVKKMIRKKLKKLKNTYKIT